MCTALFRCAVLCAATSVVVEAEAAALVDSKAGDGVAGNGGVLSCSSSSSSSSTSIGCVGDATGDTACRCKAGGGTGLGLLRTGAALAVCVSGDRAMGGQSATAAAAVAATRGVRGDGLRGGDTSRGDTRPLPLGAAN